MAAVRRVFDTDHLRLVGLHSHIGSQIFDVDGFEIAAHRVIGLLRDVVAEFGVDKTVADRRPSISVGAWAFRTCRRTIRPPVEDLAAKLVAIVAQRVGPRSVCPRRGWSSSPDAPSRARERSPSTRSAPSRTLRSAPPPIVATSASTAA